MRFPSFIGQLIFAVVAGCFLFFSTFAAETTAPCTPGQAGCSVNTNTAPNAQNSTLILREPILPGKNIIDVGSEQGSIGILGQYIRMIYKYMLAFGSIAGMVMIMFSGIKLLTSAGESGPQGEAKEAIVDTIQALAVLYLAGLILYVINPNFFTLGGGSS